MRLQGNTSVQYRPTPRLISNPLLSSVSLDFRTNRSSGLLLYMSPSANNTVCLKIPVRLPPEHPKTCMDMMDTQGKLKICLAMVGIEPKTFEMSAQCSAMLIWKELDSVSKHRTLEPA